MSELIVTMTKQELAALVAEQLQKQLAMVKEAPRPEPAQADEAQLLTKVQAARLLGVCLSTIDNHARAGNLTRHYIGKSVRFSRKEVAQLAQPKQARRAGQSMLK